MISNPTSASEIIVLLKKKKSEILLDLADFALQEQPEDNFTVGISRAWYNDPYTMTAKPIKSQEFGLYNDPVFNKTHCILH